MFKSAMVLALVMVATSVSFAGSRENFVKCSSANSSWMQRWGKYVVSFNRAAALKACNQNTTYPVSVGVSEVSCKIDGSWVAAGYTCDAPAGI